MDVAEQDFLWMTALIFTPSVVALLLLLVPRGKEEVMRWMALFGTAVTLGISLGILSYYINDVVNRYHDQPEKTTLEHRVREALLRSNSGDAHLSDDWVTRYDWIKKFHIQYYLGLDGISLALVLLTTLISFLAMIASWKIDRHVRGYCMLFLILETGMLGTFLALDFFLFYIFWEVMLLPMYFLIGVWGGPRREYAAIKFFLYTLLGSVFILIALLGFYFTDIRDVASHGSSSQAVNSFDLIQLQEAGREAARILKGDRNNLMVTAQQEQADVEQKQRAAEKAGGPTPEHLLKERHDAEARVDRLRQPFFFSPAFQVTMFLLLFVGFAIKVPVFPFHTWLPDAHVEAPTPISMILAGVLLKMGGYGIIRIAYPICPWAAETLGYYVALFGIINIVYGAFAAMAQTDFKKLVAYSSVSHMGYVILGIAVWSQGPNGNKFWEWGMNGAMFQMLAHGITSAGMFFCVGVIYERAHHRNLNNFRGLYEPMPLYGGISAIIFFAAMGLPGLCGFVGEFMVVLATYEYNVLFSILSALTVVITAAYILWTIQRVYLGTNPAYKDYPDITLGELACIVPLVILSVLLGVAPGLVMSWMEPTVSMLVRSLWGS
jgi:NADH-quinone oxidoreductase subunit M